MLNQSQKKKKKNIKKDNSLPLYDLTLSEPHKIGILKLKTLFTAKSFPIFSVFNRM